MENRVYSSAGYLEDTIVSVNRAYTMNILARSTVLFLLLLGLQAQAAMVLTLAHIYPPEHPTAKSLLRFAETVKTRSQGRILAKVHGEANLGNHVAELHSLRNGSLDLSVLSQGPTTFLVPEFGALGLPFLFPDAATAWRVLDGTIGQQLAQKAAAKGLVVLTYWDIEARHISNAVRPIRKPADMVGLKIRVSSDPVSVDIITALGGKPQEINYSDVYKALRQGVVDGNENPLVNIHASKLYEFQKFISLTGHKYSIYFLLMSKLTWDSLPANDQAIVLAAAKEAASYQRELTRTADEDAYRDMLAKGVRIDKVDTQPFIASTAKIYDKWYASPIGDFVHAVVKAAREE
jgi:TRAP-type transport system periplasmic protein